MKTKTKLKYTLPGQMLTILAAHAQIALVCSIIWAVFMPIWTQTAGRYVFAIIGTIGYFFATYATGCDAARNDKKSYTESEPKLYKAFVLTAILAAVNILFILFYRLLWKYFATEAGFESLYTIVGNFIPMMWFSMYEFFAGMEKGHFSLLGYAIIFILPAISTGGGYIAGYYNIDIFEKIRGIAYEKNNKQQ